MWILATIPFALQALAILLDEGIFHLKRGLPLWERIGHPLDTLGTLICLLFVLTVPYSASALKIYIALAIFSSLLVTKDEFIHKHHCPALEQWLHALLFLLHPVALAMAGLIWPVISGAKGLAWLNYPEPLRQFLYLQSAAMGSFMFYQIIYWNFLWKGSAKRQ